MQCIIMKPIRQFLTLCLFLTFPSLIMGAKAQDDPDEKKIRWVPIEEFNEKDAMPFGWEEVIPGAFADSYIITGNISEKSLVGTYNDQVKKCLVDHSQKTAEVEKGTCKYLTYPAGTMSWLYATPDSLPEMKWLIKAGKEGKEWFYVCRVVDPNGNLVPGYWKIKDKKCQAGFGEAKTISSLFEMLSVNALGMQFFKKIRGIDHFFG